MEILEREGCLRQLEDALADALAGHGRVALVGGEAGIGKTTLVRRFTQVRRPRVRIVSGACEEQFTPRPLGPLHDIAAELGGIVPRLLADNAERSAIFLGLLDELRDRPTIAVFEDVHWADEATLDLLGFLARRLAQCRTLLILTYRDDELGPRHPLRLTLGDLASSGVVRRVGLQPLSADAVRSLVGTRGVDVSALRELTGGNPFFVTEVLAEPGSGLPATVRDAVLARAARLSAGAQEVLQAAAVAGPRIESWLLERMGLTDARVVDECLGIGVLVSHVDVLAFRHELARQVIVETISPPRRVELHRQALQALQTPLARRRDAARLAHHAAGAQDCAAILEHASAAARQAAEATAHREAAALYGLALGCADELPPPERAAILEAYSWECNVIDQRAEAVAARATAVALWRAVGNTLKQAENLARQVPMLIGVGRNDAAERCSNAAVALLESLPRGAEFALACRMQALVALARRDAEEAIRWGEQGIELARTCGEEDVIGMTEAAVGSARMILDYEQGRVYLDRCLRRTVAHGRPTHAANNFAHLGRRSAELYAFDHAHRYLSEGMTFTDGRDLDTFHLMIRAWQSFTLMHRGAWVDAATLARGVLLREGTSAVNRLPALVALGRLQARGASSVGAVEGPLDEALALAEPIGTSETLGMVRAARAEAAWAAGDRASTLAEASAGYALALRERHAWVAGELAYWRWRAGAPKRPPDWIAGPFKLHVRGDWCAAAEAWRRLGCPYEEARALSEGDASAQTRALMLFDRLGADRPAAELRRTMRAQGVSRVPRGPYASTRANQHGLTTRQIEILKLLVDGLTNPEIGERLSITSKTAEHHVAAVLAKLEVRSRREAAVLARQSGILGSD
jgi:DNA-binding CsgD family transcriptional regulator